MPTIHKKKKKPTLKIGLDSFSSFSIYRDLRNNDSSSSLPTTDQNHETQQNLIVMRHGDRLDQADPTWALRRTSGRKPRQTTPSEVTQVHKSFISRFLRLIKTTPCEEKPWDPPLTEAGKERAFITGREFRNKLGFPIHRVFVSPFFRCIQTAKEVVSALCAIEDDPNVNNGDNININPSKIKVSIEYGLCEMMNSDAIKLEALFPAGTVDSSAEHFYKELPAWEESRSDARKRFKLVIQTIGDKYPSENLLFVTHGEGVGGSISEFLMDTMVNAVEYCAYSHLKRQISFSPSGPFSAGKIEVLTTSGQSGIRYTHITEDMSLDD